MALMKLVSLSCTAKKLTGVWQFQVSDHRVQLLLDVVSSMVLLKASTLMVPKLQVECLVHMVKCEGDVSIIGPAGPDVRRECG